jgi:hypothetical protein
MQEFAKKTASRDCVLGTHTTVRKFTDPLLDLEQSWPIRGRIDRGKAMTRIRKALASQSRTQARACFAEAYPFPVGTVFVMLVTGEIALVIGMLTAIA